jgi:hypothetical protein
MIDNWQLVLGVLLFVFHYLLLRFSQHCVYIMLDSMYVSMSISIGLYPTLDLLNVNKLHYITCWLNNDDVKYTPNFTYPEGEEPLLNGTLWTEGNVDKHSEQDVNMWARLNSLTTAFSSQLL